MFVFESRLIMSTPPVSVAALISAAVTDASSLFKCRVMVVASVRADVKVTFFTSALMKASSLKSNSIGVTFPLASVKVPFSVKGMLAPDDLVSNAFISISL